VNLYLKVSDENDTINEIKEDLILKANNDQKIYCYFLDEDGAVYDTVKNKPTDSDATAILSKTITSFTNPTSGEAIITLTDTETKSLLGNYIYSIALKFNSGLIKTGAEGNLLFKREIRSTY
jgi:hypothetical protein